MIDSVKHTLCDETARKSAMKLRIIAILICIFVIVAAQICIAKTEFDRFKDKFNTNYEIATCAISYYFIQNGELKLFTIKHTSGIYSGNANNITYWCSWKYNTDIHTHPNGYCEPSKMDLDDLTNAKWKSVSVIYCGLNTFKVLIKSGKEIKQYNYQS
jgi:hypothetical protein